MFYQTMVALEGSVLLGQVCF